MNFARNGGECIVGIVANVDAVCDFFYNEVLMNRSIFQRDFVHGNANFMNGLFENRGVFFIDESGVLEFRCFPRG